MKIFTYASYDPNVATVKYIADAVTFLTGAKAIVVESPPFKHVEGAIEVYYIDHVPIVDSRGITKEFKMSTSFLTGRSDRIYVSAAHTERYLAIALSDQPIGIDIECKKHRDNYARIADKIGESCSNEDEFYQIWTRYEARIKARGTMSAYCKAYNVLGAFNVDTLPIQYYDVFDNTLMAVAGVGNAEFTPMEIIYLNESK